MFKLLKYRLWLLFIFALLLSACSTGRYRHAYDSTPSRTPTPAELVNAIPRAEPYSRGGNKNYEVRGINYKVLSSAQGFEQTGIASWYGSKFHGHLTSNGEIYDMYSMSAAHKNLPLPTYAKVTNLANNKSVIVRVNDRGPFHQNRIIDLSYSAAYKLDMLKTGTAKVSIVAITDFNKPAKTIPKKTVNITSVKQEIKQQPFPKKPVALQSRSYIQVFATGQLALAQKTATALTAQLNHPVSYPYQNKVYRILIGPFDNEKQQKQVLNELKQKGYPNAYIRRL